MGKTSESIKEAMMDFGLSPKSRKAKHDNAIINKMAVINKNCKVEIRKN